MDIRHHRLSQGEIRDAGYDTTSLVEERFRAAMAAPADPRSWNTNNKRWGGIWFAVQTTYPYQVIAGLEGEMQGVVVATFERPGKMEQFGDDFAEGKTFALENGALWQAYVREAHAARKFDTDTFTALLARGRDSGITSEGQAVTVADLKQQYA